MRDVPPARYGGRVKSRDSERDGPDFVPRPHQVEARDAILAARRAGRPGFLLGDLTGLGKTLSAWLGDRRHAGDRTC